MEIFKSTIITVIIVRLFGVVALYVDKINFVYYDNSYHFYYGLLFVLIAIVATIIKKKVRYIFYGIGLGLIIDDLAVIKYIITGTPTNPESDYWAPLFVIPLLLGLLIISFFEEKIKKVIR